MYRIPRIQSTELKKVNKQEDASMPLGREKKIITGGKGREGQDQTLPYSPGDSVAEQPWAQMPTCVVNHSSTSRRLVSTRASY